MGTEGWKAENDNFTKAELRAQDLEKRKNLLLDFGSSVKEVRDWIKEKQKEIDDSGESIPETRKQEMSAALKALENTASTTDEAIDAAEGSPNSDKELATAFGSYDELSNLFERTRQLFEDE